MPPASTTQDRSKEIATAVDKAQKLPDNATDAQKFAAGIIAKALALHHEREENTKQTGLNRDMLRNLAGQGDVLTADQAAAVAAIYPLPKKREKPDSATPALDKKDAERADEGKPPVVTGGPQTGGASTTGATPSAPTSQPRR